MTIVIFIATFATTQRLRQIKAIAIDDMEPHMVREAAIAAVARCDSYGIHNADDQHWFAGLMMRVSRSFDTHPMVLSYLRDETIPPEEALTGTEKKAVIEKVFADLNVLKKQEEAAEAAAKGAKIGKDAKKPADCEKDAAQDEKAATKDAKDKDCEDCGKAGKPLKKMKKVKVDPCFSPKKLDLSKAKEFAEQLKRQEDALNRMTEKEYNEARVYFDRNKRGGTGKAQKEACDNYEKVLKAKLLKEKIRAKVENPREAAEEEAKELMKNIAALHEPDMIAGGHDIVTNMGDRGVNSSIGSQWRNRVKSIDTETNKIPLADQEKTKMNVKLPIC